MVPLLTLTSFLFEGSECSDINLPSFNYWRYPSANAANMVKATALSFHTCTRKSGIKIA